VSEKTEEPSPRRLRQAREKGDIPVSGALVQTGALLAALCMLPSVAEWTATTLVRLIQETTRGRVTDPRQLVGALLWLVLPILGTAAAGALAVGLAQTGGAFVPSKWVPKLENLDPIEGFKRLFKMDRIYQVLRAFVTACLVAWLSVDLLLSETRSIANTVGAPQLSMVLGALLAKKVLWLGVGVSAALALVDVLVTRKLWLKRNRMTKQEVKQEYKDSEGDPQLKQERKRAHQEMLNHSAVLSVKDANVVVVNPTHLASALRYDEDEDEAPIVVAQGQGELAKQIVDAARAYGIPVVRDVPVARALRELEVGDQIPEELYEAVAEILKELWEQEGNSVP
jgi:FlhB-like protein